MAIMLYNTLSRRKEELLTREEGKVAMYVCGPTVYGYIHIGNARTFLSFDMIRRYLGHRGYQVAFVQNITDVDDKIINRAREEGIAPEEVASKYTAAFQEEMGQMGVALPDSVPKATEYIPQMIALVKQLEDKGLAYEVEGDVFFEIRKFPAYGKLSGRSLDELRAGERVEIDARKRDPMDFALWKSAKPGEPSWESPWGPGRPGWHIECSAMSLEILESGFDIHGGAQDLIFPHHENEVAQSEGASGREFVRYWLHAGLLALDKEKMSKSLGNILSLKEVMEKWEPSAIRLFVMTAHYRQPLDFSLDSLDAATASLGRLRETFRKSMAAQKSGAGQELAERYDRFPREFYASMDDDFNAPAAVAALFEMAKQINADLGSGESAEAAAAAFRLKELFVVLGVDIEARAELAGIWSGSDAAEASSLMGSLMGKEAPGKADVALLVELRNWYRRERDFGKADSIRDRLQELGVTLDDTGKEETRWHWSSPAP